MSATPPTHRRSRRRAVRSGLGAGVAIAVGAATLVAPSAASADRVTSLKPWKATNAYLAKDDIDGRTRPQLEPRAKTNHVRKGSWVRISCQTTGQSAYGSTVWSKVGAYYVPDQLLKTYTDGFIPGVPRCGAGAPAPAPGTPSPAPAPPTNFFWQLGQTAAFGDGLPSGTTRVTETTGARTGTPGVVMLRLFIPDAQAGGRLLKGDGRGWSPNPSHAVASRASLFWDTETGRVSLSVAPTHVSDALPKTFWGIKRRCLRIVSCVYYPSKYDLPDRIRGGASNAALRIVNHGAEKDVDSTDFHARSTNDVAIYGSGSTKTVYAKMSLLNSVTNTFSPGAWSVDTKVTIHQTSPGRFSVRTEGNGYPAVEAYWYPKRGGTFDRLFLRRIHPYAYERSIKAGPLPSVGTGTVDPGGGIAALDIASNLDCRSRAGGGSECERDGMGANPLPNIIAPSSYRTSVSDRAG